MQCGYCGGDITEGEDFCKKCVEGYKIDNKKNTVSAAKLKPRKTKPTLPKPEPIASSPFAKMGMRFIGFIIAGFIFGFFMYILSAIR